MSGSIKNLPTYSNATMQPLGGASAAGIAAGTNVIVAGVSGQIITVLYLCMVAASGATTVQLCYGKSTATTPMSDAITLGLASGYPQGVLLDHHDCPVALPVGQGFCLVTTGSTVNGYLIYKQGL
jgi:hypothetical protein